MINHGGYFYGEPFDSWIKMKKIIEMQGYPSIASWIEENENKKESSAKIAFLRARIERIKELTKVDI